MTATVPAPRRPADPALGAYLAYLAAIDEASAGYQAEAARLLAGPAGQWRRRIREAAARYEEARDAGEAA